MGDVSAGGGEVGGVSAGGGEDWGEGVGEFEWGECVAGGTVLNIIEGLLVFEFKVDEGEDKGWFS